MIIDERKRAYVLRSKRNGETTPENKYPTVYARVEIGDTVMLKDELWQKLWSGASVPKKILIKFMYFL